MSLNIILLFIKLIFKFSSFTFINIYMSCYFLLKIVIGGFYLNELELVQPLDQVGFLIPGKFFGPRHAQSIR